MPNLELTLTPAGHLFLELTPEPVGLPDDAPEAVLLSAAFEVGTGYGLLRLAMQPPVESLPPEFAFWRRFAHEFLTALCLAPTLETDRGSTRIVFPHEKMKDWPDEAPPMRGAEFLSLKLLEKNWEALHEAFAEAAAEHTGSMQTLLGSWDPVLHVLGRVYFHLAENKQDPALPFAFLATYTTGVSHGGKPQHIPLSHALQEFAGARNKSALAKLLAPVSEASKTSAMVKDLVDSGAIFRTLAWTPSEAYRFLRDVPHCEQAGLLCRVPDWWRAARKPRVQVGVSVGGAAPVGLGANQLLSFSVDMALDGEAITDAEWKRIAASTDGLTLIRGKWVELDREKLDELLKHWRKAEKAAQHGISLHEALRMLAGLDGRLSGQPEGAASEWTSVSAGGWLQSVIEKLREPRLLADVKLTAGFQATLRPYQDTGLRWLWFLQHLGLGACLADDMGLGKTVQVLALLHALKDEKRLPSLLIVPASLLGNWEAECKRFAPELAVHFAHPSMGQFSAAQAKKSALVITTYNYVIRLPELMKQEWDLVILDEAQAIKNAGTKQAQAVKSLSGRVRLALTGTPVENRLSDLWSLFDFLNPGLLGSAKTFERMVRAEGARNVTAVRQLVRPYILRRMKTDKSIIADLPDKTEMTAFCTLTKTQAVLYQKSVDELAFKLETVFGMERRGLVLAYLMRLKQICNHPSQWLGDAAFRPADSGKFDRLADLCEPIADRQEKALIFTQFQAMTEPLRQFLEPLFRRRGLVLHGGTPVKQRRGLVEQFQQDERTGFFVISVKAGGVGLNLTAATHVIHFDRWWNPAVENQATDRAYRIGQTHPVMVHKFVCRGTLEERIDAMLTAKGKLAAEVLAGTGEAWLTELGNDELLKLLSLDQNYVTMAQPV